MPIPITPIIDITTGEPSWKTLEHYKKKYEEDTNGKSAMFKINYLTGASATTNNKTIQEWIKKEQNKQRGIHFRKE